MDGQGRVGGEINLGSFLGLRRHLAVAHHVAGRVRLRLDPAALVGGRREADGLLRFPFARLEGIRSVRFNPAALSVVIEYEPDAIPASSWETLIGGSEEEVRNLFTTFHTRWGRAINDWRQGMQKEDTRR